MKNPIQSETMAAMIWNKMERVFACLKMLPKIICKLLRTLSKKHSRANYPNSTLKNSIPELNCNLFMGKSKTIHFIVANIRFSLICLENNHDPIEIAIPLDCLFPSLNK